MCMAVAALGGRAWWVAPSYPVASVGWRGIKHLALQFTGAEVRHVDRLIELPSGGTVQVRSADNPDSLRGEGLDFVVLDECAFIKEDAWREALRPALSDRQGKALFISTPAGRNWFYRLWHKELDDPTWKSWQFPTSSNPFIPQSEIDDARGDVPDRIFRQEYMAEFIQDGGGLIRGVRAAATATEQRAGIEGHEYVMGIDWGKHNDYTVISVIDATEKALVHMDRFSQIDYQTQLGRLDGLFIRFEPSQIVAERNAMGEPLIEQLQRQGYPVQAFTTTNASKAQAIDGLALAFERQDIRIVDEPVLIAELEAFEPTRLPSGMLRYAAPEGMHDDCVISLALAWHGVTNRTWIFA